jgi:hypothetical protein
MTAKKCAVLVTALLVISGCDIETPPRLSLEVAFDGDLFRVSNLDDFDWKECEFEINPRGFGDGYSFNATGIKAHDYGTVEASRFADENGLAFDRSTHVARMFVAICGTPQGKLVQTVAPTVR